MNDKQLAIQTAPSLAVFDQREIEEAIRAALPNGQNLSSDQVKAAAIVARTSDLNPFTREFHITNTGVMTAAKVAQANMNEWLAMRNEPPPEWSYIYPHAMSEQTLRGYCAQFGLDADGNKAVLYKQLMERLDVSITDDTIILVQMYLRSTHDRWLNTIKTLREMGVPSQEIIAAHGVCPKPDHEAWGIVRFKEQKTGNGKTAAEKWQEMDLKYSRLERAKKRGRTACINALMPVTNDQRRRMKVGGLFNLAPAPVPDGPRVYPPDLGPSWSIVDGNAAETPEGMSVADHAADGDTDEAIIDSPATEAPPRAEDAPHKFQPITSFPPLIPEHISIIFDKLSAKRQLYEEKGWLNTEKQDGFTQGVLKRMCGKDDGLCKTLLNILTAKEHWGDVSPGRRRAILKDWLKLDAEGKPCAEALADFEEIKKYHATQHNAN